MRKNYWLILLFIVTAEVVLAQGYQVKTSKLVYKKIGDISLEMVVYSPDINTPGKLPAIVFYFGGGWTSGSPSHFKLQAEYFASRGMVAICPDYRTKSRFNTSPFECVKDAKSAFRFIKQNADKLGIDTSRIVASGGSAGGHLAACLAIINNVNESTDNLQISTIPFALVLFNPVIDTSEKGYGAEKLKGHEFELSPAHHVTHGIPSTLILHGKDDTTVPYENVERFKHLMNQEGNECKLVGYKKQSHGFFNFGKKPKYFKKTMKRAEIFLDEKGLLKGQSWLNIYYKNLKKQNSIKG